MFSANLHVHSKRPTVLSITHLLHSEMKPQLPPHQTIVCDAGYDGILPLLAELEKRGEPYVAQAPGNVAA